MGALKTIATALAGAVTVLLLLELVPADHSSPPTPNTATTQSAVVINDRSAAEIDALRREVRSSLHAIAVTNARPPIDEEPPPPTAQQADASQTAMNVVAEAVDVGRWTGNDRERMQGLLGQLHPDDREAVLLAWAAAVNEQRLRPDVPMF
jgi:hypothetical protein